MSRCHASLPAGFRSWAVAPVSQSGGTSSSFVAVAPAPRLLLLFLMGREQARLTTFAPAPGRDQQVSGWISCGWAVENRKTIGRDGADAGSVGAYRWRWSLDREEVGASLPSQPCAMTQRVGNEPHGTPRRMMLERGGQSNWAKKLVSSPRLIESRHLFWEWVLTVGGEEQDGRSFFAFIML